MRRRPAVARALTLTMLTTALDVLGLALLLAALGVLCVMVPPVGVLLLASGLILGLSWAIEHLR